MKSQNEKILFLQNQLGEIKSMIRNNVKSLDLNEISTNYNMTVYPNPVENGTFTINIFSQNERKAVATITDIQGNSFFKQAFETCKNCENKFSNNTSNLSSGTCFVSLEIEEKILKVKISIAI